MKIVIFFLLIIIIAYLLVEVSFFIRETSSRLHSNKKSVSGMLILVFDPSTILFSIFSYIAAKYICDFIFVV